MCAYNHCRRLRLCLAVPRITLDCKRPILRIDANLASVPVPDTAQATIFLRGWMIAPACTFRRLPRPFSLVKRLRRASQMLPNSWLDKPGTQYTIHREFLGISLIAIVGSVKTGILDGPIRNSLSRCTRACHSSLNASTLMTNQPATQSYLHVSESVVRSNDT
jgi:hypothetical protein